MGAKIASNEHQPELYEIRIKGHLASHWADWFEGLTITLLDNGETLLVGPVVDQAALHGLLKKVRDLGMPLLSVIHVELEQADTPTRLAIPNSQSLEADGSQLPGRAI